MPATITAHITKKSTASPRNGAHRSTSPAPAPVLEASSNTCHDLPASYSPLGQTFDQQQPARSSKTAAVDAAPPPPNRKRARKHGPDQQSASNFTVTPKFLDQLLIPTIMLPPFAKLLGHRVDALAIYEQIQKMIEDCEMKGDPLGETLVQQVVILRFSSAFLHSMMGLANRSGDQAVLNGAACAASGELRRTIRDLDDYCRRKQRSQKKKPKTALVAPVADEAVDAADPEDVVFDHNAPSSGFPANLSEMYPSTPVFPDDAPDTLPTAEELIARSSRPIAPSAR